MSSTYTLLILLDYFLKVVALALGWYAMQYLLGGISSKVVRRISYAFDLGNGQFDGEMPVWRARLGKRLDSRKETETRPEACGAQYPKSGVSGGDG